MTAKRPVRAISGADPADPLIPNIAEYTVSEISLALKRTLEETFGHVRVRGEITGFRGAHGSGHCYFALKDDSARLEAVVWRGQFQRIKAVLQDGLEVVATGKLSAFPGSSKYQLIIDTIEPAGIGALMALVEERKRRLAAEGLFDAARKSPIPYLPGVIGVVTSPTGAVIRDILHRLADRFPRHVLVWPVRVQGDTCGAEVARAIAGFNALAPVGPIPRPDLLIVARGGGSLEDLWGFNDEVVVRAAAASAIPLISAVGHETDWTLIDFAADERARHPRRPPNAPSRCVRNCCGSWPSWDFARSGRNRAAWRSAGAASRRRRAACLGRKRCWGWPGSASIPPPAASPGRCLPTPAPTGRPMTGSPAG
jgi:exodeoxyribonuclease VII large subunit